MKIMQCTKSVSKAVNRPSVKWVTYRSVPQPREMDSKPNNAVAISARMFSPARMRNNDAMKAVYVLPLGKQAAFGGRCHGKLRILWGENPSAPTVRLLTLADTVEYFNLVLQLKLSQAEKDSLVAYLLTL